MRTTLSLDDDVLEAAREIARLEARTVGEVISALARRGLRPALASFEVREGFPVFIVPPDLPPMTPELVRSALEDE